MTEPKYPINLRAFCQLVVDKLDYATIEHVLDVLDENFDMPQDRALDCNFDQELAWAILQGEEGEGEAALVIIALALLVIVALVAFLLARIGPAAIG